MAIFNSYVKLPEGNHDHHQFLVGSVGPGVPGGHFGVAFLVKDGENQRRVLKDWMTEPDIEILDGQIWVGFSSSKTMIWKGKMDKNGTSSPLEPNWEFKQPGWEFHRKIGIWATTMRNFIHRTCEWAHFFAVFHAPNSKKITQDMLKRGMWRAQLSKGSLRAWTQPNASRSPDEFSIFSPNAIPLIKKIPWKWPLKMNRQH